MYILVNGACHFNGKAQYCYLLILIINGACHFNGKAQYCYCSYLLLLFFFFTFISARYSSHSFCHRAMNEGVKRCGLIGIVCYDFYKRSGVRCLPQGQNRGKIKLHRLNIEKKLWRLVAQRVDFTEMWNLPHLKRLAGSVRPYLKMG